MEEEEEGKEMRGRSRRQRRKKEDIMGRVKGGKQNTP